MNELVEQLKDKTGFQIKQISMVELFMEKDRHFLLITTPNGIPFSVEVQDYEYNLLLNSGVKVYNGAV